jgi:hypothetical protein
MEPVTLAATAVRLLLPLFGRAAGKGADRLGESVADAGTSAARSLYERIKAKLTSGSYGSALLDGVEERPEDPHRQQNLAAELATALADDPGFAADLRRLVTEAAQGPDAEITATGTGAVAGRDVHQTGRYVAGRDLAIGPETEG